MKRKEGSMYMGRYAGYFVWVLLVLCGMVFLFASCDNEAISEKEKKGGKLIPVSVRIAGITEGGTEEIIRSFDREKEAVTETVSIGDGMLLEMRLEADLASRLRATTPLGTGKQFRVIAVKHSDHTYVSHGDFTAGGVNMLTTFSVQSGESYDFICVSLNSADSVPTTTGLSTGEVPSFLTSPTNGVDLLYDGTSHVNKTVNSDADAELSFTLSHKFSQVTLVVDCSYNGWNITGIAANSIRLAPNFRTQMSYAGIIAKTAVEDSITDQWFSWPALTANPIQSSNAYTVFADGSPVFLCMNANALTVNAGTATSLPSGSSAVIWIPFPDKTLEAGKKYTLTVKFRTPKFAASNIYWDNTNRRLTFAVYSDTPSSVTANKYQGVYFKFGSLIGISPAGAWYENATLLYVPPTGKSTSWYITSADGTLSSLPTGIFGTIKNHTTVETGVWTGTTYATIPYVSNGVAASPNPRDGRHVIDLPVSERASFKGDICNYLNSAYRLPTSNEFSTYGDPIAWNTTSTQYGWKRVDTGGASAWLNNDNHADANAAGVRTSIVWGGAFGPTGNFFPATGYRNTLGSLTNTGNYGGYWSGSVPSVSDNGYNMGLNVDAVAPHAQNYRQYGRPIRCILQ
jgi:hypothetical protein